MDSILGKFDKKICSHDQKCSLSNDKSERLGRLSNDKITIGDCKSQL